MDAKTLTRPAKCASCGETIPAGEPFAWELASKPTSKPGLRLAAWRPRHVGECPQTLGERMEAERAAMLADCKARAREICERMRAGLPYEHLLNA